MQDPVGEDRKPKDEHADDPADAAADHPLAIDAVGGGAGCGSSGGAAEQPGQALRSESGGVMAFWMQVR